MTIPQDSAAAALPEQRGSHAAERDACRVFAVKTAFLKGAAEELCRHRNIDKNCWENYVVYGIHADAVAKLNSSNGFRCH